MSLIPVVQISQATSTIIDEKYDISMSSIEGKDFWHLPHKGGVSP